MLTLISLSGTLQVYMCAKSTLRGSTDDILFRSIESGSDLVKAAT